MKRRQWAEPLGAPWDRPPAVSVIVPVLDESGSIDEVLDRLRAQTVHDFEAVFADGGSTDGTRERILEASRLDPRIRVVDNPRMLQSAGLNAALRAARADYVVRLDGHCFIPHDYLEQTLDVLRCTGADGVGGRMVPRPAASLCARAIALANAAPWGAGPARFHGGGTAGPVDTVYLGSFIRSRIVELGGWAEDVGVNEDYELNHRIRATGGTVWFDPRLQVGYRPRSTVRSLIRQYFRYGRSKATVSRRHPRSVRPRQVLPALGVPVLLGSLAWGWTIALPFLLVHLALVSAAGLASAWRDGPARRVGLVAGWAAFSMHWAWSVGFWFGMVRPFPSAAESSRA